MKRILQLFTLLFTFCLTGHAQFLELPNASPTMTYIDEDGAEAEDVQYDGDAPLQATFRANPEHLGNYTPLYEWQFRRMNESQPFLIRYEENTEYEFRESGAFLVDLKISFVEGNDTIEYAMDEPFTITLSESKLEVPNAFTPNGDGINDIFKVKEGYRSIIEFKATVFDRWGKKLYSWTDLEGGWDGKCGGHEVPDGAYYLHIQARGADGRKYHIRKAINILRGFTETLSNGQ